MKLIIFVIVLFIVSPLVQAQDRPDSAASEVEGQPQQSSTGTDSAPPPVPWPKPFKPSEKIGADSQISFPTDI